MSALRSAFKPLLVLVAIRASFAFVFGVAPSGVVLDQVRQFPSGELALLDREGALLAELARRAPASSSLGLSLSVLTLLAHLACLPVLGALIADLAQGRGPILERLAQGLRSSPALALASGAAALGLSFAAYLGLSAAAPLVAVLPLGTPARAVVAVALGVLALVPAAFGAVLVDCVRVEIVMGEPSWSGRARAAWSLVSRRAFRLVALYGAVAAVTLLVSGVGAGIAAALLVRPGAVAAWMGAIVALLTLGALAWIRAVWLGRLVRLSRNDREVLHPGEGLGYEAPETSRNKPR